jgi:hydrogenase nickel incorporation protein HypA/HybF
MHELSIADAVVALACANANGARVAKVELKVGRLRQVVPSALEFAWEIVCEGTPAEGAELEVEHVAIRITCRTCGAEHELDDFPLACASCGSVDADVVAGDELLVESIELEHEPAAAGRR